MAEDQARIEISASSSRLDAGLRAAAEKTKRWALSVQAQMAKAADKSLHSAARASAGLAGNLGGRGMDLIASQAKNVKTFEESLVRLQIAGTMSAAKVDEVRFAARKVSTALGVNSQEIIEGTQAYVDLTGDVAGATSSLETFARISQASGAAVKDVATGAAALKGIGVDLKDMEATFSGLVAQGKAGAVSLKDFAGELAGLAPRWQQFKGGASALGIRELGAALQVARQGFGNASEAATGMIALMGSFKQDAMKFEAVGVKIYDKHPKTGVKTMRTFEQIMSSIEKSKLIADPTLMNQALGSKEAEQTITMLLKARQHVAGQASEYQKLVKSGEDAGAVQRDLDTYLASSSGKLSQVWEGLKNAIADAFTADRIETFLEIVKDVAEAIGTVIDGLGEIKDNLTGKSKMKENPFAFQAEEFREPVADVFGMGGLAGGLVAQYDADRANQSMSVGAKGGDPRLKTMDENRKAFDKGMEYIEGQKTRSERIKTAVSAMTSTAYGGVGNEFEAGGEGRREAGRRWVKAEQEKGNLKDSEVKAVEAALWQAQEEKKKVYDEQRLMAGKIVDAIKAGFDAAKGDVNLDGNKVSTGVDKSTNARKRVW